MNHFVAVGHPAVPIVDPGAAAHLHLVVTGVVGERMALAQTIRPRVGFHLDVAL